MRGEAVTAFAKDISGSGFNARASARVTHPAWLLFLLLNATLFMRPAEIVPQFEGLPIYEVIIVVCLLLSFTEVVQQLRLQALAGNPITVCVLGMLPAIMLSHLAHSDRARASYYGQEFVKVILYYLLLISLVNSRRRLRQLLFSLAIYALLLNVVALLSYHQLLNLGTVTPMEESQFQADPGAPRVVVVRLVAAGIYGNPNDLARIIVVGITVGVCFMLDEASWALRLTWFVILAVFAYALKLTYSRGGLLALVAAIAVCFQARYGSKRSLVLGLVVLIPSMVFFGGRQTDIDTDTGTAQSRIQLWSTGLVALRESPVFGIGTSVFKEVAGNHAHNSFVETYVETGLVGGTLFLSAFYLAATCVYRLKAAGVYAREADLWKIRPCVLALIGGSIVGQMSSARGYSLPTYMVLGVASAYLSIVEKETGLPVTRVSLRLVARLIVVSAVSLMSIHLYTKFSAHF
jgi:O-antigen ligase